jgi:hypothetical protein
MARHTKAGHLAFATVGLVAGLLVAPAEAGEVNVGYFGNVAIQGYDTVAYFTEHRAVKGSDEYSYDWLGATWLFASSEHRDLFSADPMSYAPQYGGHCADGVAYGGVTVNIDPNAWRIIDGKLYLNHDEGAAIELEELPGQLEKAEANWPKLRAELVAE